MLPCKLSVLEIPSDNELTADCLVETRTKLEELIPTAKVDFCLNRVQPLVVAAGPGNMVPNGLVYFGPQLSANICKVC